MHTNIFRMSGKTHPQTKSDLVQKSPEPNQTDLVQKSPEPNQTDLVQKSPEPNQTDLVQKSPEPNQTDSTFDFTKTIGKQNSQVWSMQHKMFLTWLDVMTKNIVAYNSTCKTFANISKGIIDSWASTMKQNCNQQD